MHPGSLDLRLALPIALAAALTACVTGPVRKVEAGAFGAYPDRRTVQIEVDGPGSPALHESLVTGALAGLSDGAGLSQAPAGDPAPLRLQLHLSEVSAPLATRVARPADPLAQVKADLDGTLHPVETSGRLVFQGELLAPDGRHLGAVEWDGKGKPEAAARGAGYLSGAALGQALDARRFDLVPRRASDERLFLTPTPYTLRAGEISVSTDEVLALRLAVGISRRVQVDVWGGVLPVPLAGAAPLVIPGLLLGTGGAALGAVGALDLGVKIRVLDETRTLPGVALGYDLLDANMSVIGAGAFVFAGAAIGVGAGVGGGTVNAQFNLFTLTASKHFGAGSQLGVGVYVLDNHHFLPQSASFVAVAGMAGSGGAGGVPVAGSTPIERLPVQVQPFINFEQVIGPHSAFAAELFPWVPARPVLGTTGFRWILGASEPEGRVALDRIRVRLDLAGLWMYVRGDAKQGTRSVVAPMPWVGAGLLFF